MAVVYKVISFIIGNDDCFSNIIFQGRAQCDEYHAKLIKY